MQIQSWILNLHGLGSTSDFSNLPVRYQPGNSLMPENIYNLQEAKLSLAQLIDRAAKGEEIIITKAGRPVAKLVPVNRHPGLRKPGGWEGRIRISEDFEAAVS